MYAEKKEMLKERELQRMVKQYLRWSLEEENPNEDYSYIENLPYDNLPCSNEERAELRAYAEERIIELEENVTFNTDVYGQRFTPNWPMNLVRGIYGYQESYDFIVENVDEVFEEILKTFPLVRAQCLLKRYKEGMSWDGICDELNIYVTELEEHICMGLRNLRHPSNSKKLVKKKAV